MNMTKRLSLYKIRDMAINSGISVFNVDGFAKLINKNANISRVYMNRLVKNNLAVKLLNGKIAFTDDVFVIASQLIDYSYISMNSALEFHGISYQVTKNVECVTTINSIKFENLGIEYHKIKPELYFGYKRYKKGVNYIFVADPDKAVIDGLYLGLYNDYDISEFKENIDFLNIINTLKNIKIRGVKKILEVLK